MQIVQNKNQVIEKILRDKEGRLVRATFAVFEQNGRIKARLLHAVAIVEEVVETLFLSAGFSSKKVYSKLLSYEAIVSPYFNSVLYFSGSKPRAPTF